MDERPKYPESLSEVMEDADNREPSVMDTLYGLPFPLESESGNNVYSDTIELVDKDEDLRERMERMECMKPVYASPSPGLLGIIRRLFGR